jgi:hypothetical protein
MMLKVIFLQYMQVPCQSRLCKADHAYLIYRMVQWQLSHLNGRNALTDSLYIFGTDLVENTASNSSIVEGVSVAQQWTAYC